MLNRIYITKYKQEIINYDVIDESFDLENIIKNETDFELLEYIVYNFCTPKEKDVYILLLQNVSRDEIVNILDIGSNIRFYINKMCKKINIYYNFFKLIPVDEFYLDIQKLNKEDFLMLEGVFFFKSIAQIKKNGVKIYSSSTKKIKDSRKSYYKNKILNLLKKIINNNDNKEAYYYLEKVIKNRYRIK